MPEEVQVLGKCPACGGDIVESSRAYGCSNWRDNDGGCHFSIWKTIAQRPITPSEAKLLLEQGKTPVLQGFVSKKTGNTFAAALELGEDFHVNFKFEKR